MLFLQGSSIDLNTVLDRFLEDGLWLENFFQGSGSGRVKKLSTCLVILSQVVVLRLLPSESES